MTASLHEGTAPSDASNVLASPAGLARGQAAGGATGLRVLLDLALKQLDLQDRSFDTVNTRAGVVFGFSTLLLSAFKPVLDGVGPGAPRFWFGLLIVGAWGSMLIACWRAFRVRGVSIGPDVHELFQSNLDTAAEAEAQGMALGSTLQGILLNRQTLDRKARALQWALVSVAALIVVLVAGAAFPYLRGELWPWLGRVLTENTSPVWVGGTRP